MNGTRLLLATFYDFLTHHFQKKNAKSPCFCLKSENTYNTFTRTLVAVLATLVCRGLKRPLERLLAGLLETDDRNRWSYDAFFNESLALTSRPPVYVFCLSSARIERLYVTSPKITSVLSVFSYAACHCDNGYFLYSFKHCCIHNVAWWLSGSGGWTCDLQVAGSIPGRWLSRNIGQLSLASLRGR